MKKKFLMVGIGTTLVAATTAQADYIYDAALLLKEQKIEVVDLEKKFTESEIKAVKAKVQEMQEKSNNKKNIINVLTRKRAMELKQAGTKKSTEDQERDRDRTKDLEKETKSKERHEEKDLILIGDLEKNLNKKISNLEKRVSKLEKNETTKNSSNKPKVATKVATESKKSSKISKSEAVQNVLRGKYGDGDERRETLRKLGFTDKEIISIQKEVNQLMEN